MRRASLAILLAGIVATGLDASISIQGTVTDATQQPVANAIVTASSVTVPPASQSVPSGANGSFQITGLAAGSYSLCVQVPGSAYLDSCLWGGSGPVVKVADGQQSANNVLKLQSGATLSVVISDPNNEMGQVTKQGMPPDLMMGVWGPKSLFYPVHLAIRNAQSTTYQMTIPAGTPLKFTIQSLHLNLADSQGQPLANNSAQMNFQSPAGGAAPTFTYVITGMTP